MKCQKCGKNEVNFHYSSTVNGCVTETNLCSQCAAESGYDINKLFSVGNIFEALMPVYPAQSGFMPMAVPVISASTVFPFTLNSAGMSGQKNVCECGSNTQNAQNRHNICANKDVEVDEEMRTRRELRAQMRIAVENEEFEKAAQLRDKLKELESFKEQNEVTSENAGDNV